MNEQIKEMAKLMLWGQCPQEECPKGLPEDINACNYCRATALYNAGYRKQSDTVKEFADRLKDLMGISDTKRHKEEDKWKKLLLIG